MTSKSRRFPVGLTIAAAVGVAICSSLGAWQLQRAAWKTHVLAEMAARRAAPPQPIDVVLARAAQGADVGFTRVMAPCGGGPESFRAGSDGTEWVWRAMAVCVLASASYASIEVDRGLLDSSRGSTTPPTTAISPIGRVIGVLRPSGGDARGRVEAPYVLVAEREDPAPVGVTPERFAAEVPDNLQYVGAYAPTWFGLAAVLAGVYAAMLWRRLRGS